MSTFDDLVASRRNWIDDVLEPWCRTASLADLRKAGSEWGNIAGTVDVESTLWLWAWSRFPDLVNQELSAVDETHEVQVTLEDGRVVTGYPDARETGSGRLVVVSADDEHGPFLIDEIVEVVASRQ